jgi:MFS family permease
VTRRFRLTLLGALYFAQGVPWGLVTVTLALHLTRAGLGAPELATLFVWATMPWSFKFLMGPIVDALGARAGRRRWLILGAELAMVASLIALASVDAVDRRAAFLALVFVHNLCAAFQDVATDGLAIAILPVDERGRANGIMSGAKFAGTLAGGPLLSTLATSHGWPLAAGIAAALTLAPSALLRRAREPSGGAEPRADQPRTARGPRHHAGLPYLATSRPMPCASVVNRSFWKGPLPLRTAPASTSLPVVKRPPQAPAKIAGALWPQCEFDRPICVNITDSVLSNSDLSPTRTAFNRPTRCANSPHR